LHKESVAGRILRGSGKATSGENLRQVISDAGARLNAIDKAVRTRRAQERLENEPALDPSLLPAINPLLDLLLLEGVYPSISLDIGFRERLRKSSLFYSKDADKFPNLDMLQTILVDILNPIAFDVDSGISSQVQDRILTELIIANFDLTFSPAREKTVQVASKSRLDHIWRG
jgi:hypothetical protein